MLCLTLCDAERLLRDAVRVLCDAVLVMYLRASASSRIPGVSYSTICVRSWVITPKV
jgi:hypothetical protein